MYWLNFLHLYQPPTQDRQLIEKVDNESYKPLINILTKFPNYRITLNITGCLLEMLEAYGRTSVINVIKKLLDKEQIELVGSAKFHPILPLIPDEEVKRQIRINNETLKKYFGELYKPKGFFLPEMAYNKNIAKIIEDEGFQWIILGELAYNGKFNTVNWDKGYTIKGTDLKVVFNNQKISKTFVPETILKLSKEENPPNFIITATDCELYGHHHKDREDILTNLLTNGHQVTTLTISELFEKYETFEKVKPLASTWESTEEELKKNIPYSLWNDPENKIQTKLWRITYDIIRIVNKHKNDPNFYWARWHLDRSLASCTFWWCSRKKPSPFCPITWNPDEIEKGLNELIKALRSIENLPKKEKIKFEKQYFNIKKLIWQEHWEGNNNE